MKITGMLLLLALTLTACNQSAPTDSLESLVAHPERLKEVERQCKENHAKVGDFLCNMASEARRRRFMGDRKGNYTSPSPPQN